MAAAENTGERRKKVKGERERARGEVCGEDVLYGTRLFFRPSVPSGIPRSPGLRKVTAPWIDSGGGCGGDGGALQPHARSSRHAAGRGEESGGISAPVESATGSRGLGYEALTKRHSGNRTEIEHGFVFAGRRVLICALSRGHLA